MFDARRTLPQLRYFNRAVLDFSEVVKSIVDAKTDWNMIGLCRGQLGEPHASEEAYRRALAIDPSFKVTADVCCAVVACASGTARAAQAIYVTSHTYVVTWSSSSQQASMLMYTA